MPSVDLTTQFDGLAATEDPASLSEWSSVGASGNGYTCEDDSGTLELTPDGDNSAIISATEYTGDITVTGTFGPIASTTRPILMARATGSTWQDGVNGLQCYAVKVQGNNLMIGGKPRGGLFTWPYNYTVDGLLMVGVAELLVELTVEGETTPYTVTARVSPDGGDTWYANKVGGGLLQGTFNGLAYPSPGGVGIAHEVAGATPANFEIGPVPDPVVLPETLGPSDWTYARTGTVQATDPRNGTIAENSPNIAAMLLTTCQALSVKADPIGEGDNNWWYIGYTAGYHWAKTATNRTVYRSVSGASGTWEVAWSLTETGDTLGLVFPLPNGTFLANGTYDGEDGLHLVTDITTSSPTFTTVIFDKTGVTEPKFTDGTTADGSLQWWSFDCTPDGQQVAITEYNNPANGTDGGSRIFWSTDYGATFTVLADAKNSTQMAALGLSEWKHIHGPLYNPTLNKWFAFIGDVAVACALEWDAVESPTITVMSPQPLASQPVSMTAWGTGALYGDDTASQIGYVELDSSKPDYGQWQSLWSGWEPYAAALFSFGAKFWGGLFYAQNQNDLPTVSSVRLYRDSTMIAILAADVDADRNRPPASQVGRIETSAGNGFYDAPGAALVDGKIVWAKPAGSTDENQTDAYVAPGDNERSWCEHVPVRHRKVSGIVVEQGSNITAAGVSDGSDLSEVNRAPDPRPWSTNNGPGTSHGFIQSSAGEGLFQSTCGHAKLDTGGTNSTYKIFRMGADDLTTGDHVTVSFWMRATNSLTVAIRVINESGNPVDESNGYFTIGKTWQRYVVSGVMTAGHQYGLQFVMSSAETSRGATDIFLDGVCADVNTGRYNFYSTEDTAKPEVSYTGAFDANEWTDVFEIAPEFSSHSPKYWGAAERWLRVREWENGSGDVITLDYGRHNITGAVTSAVASGAETTLTDSTNSPFTEDMVGCAIVFTTPTTKILTTIKSVTSSSVVVLESNRAGGVTGDFTVMRSVWRLTVDTPDEAPTTAVRYIPARQVFAQTAGYKFALSNDDVNGIVLRAWAGDGWQETSPAGDPLDWAGAITIYAGGQTPSLCANHVLYNVGVFNESLTENEIEEQFLSSVTGGSSFKTIPISDGMVVVPRSTLTI
jgi:hypothetical protein